MCTPPDPEVVCVYDNIGEVLGHGLQHSLERCRQGLCFGPGDCLGAAEGPKLAPDLLGWRSVIVLDPCPAALPEPRIVREWASRAIQEDVVILLIHTFHV